MCTLVQNLENDLSPSTYAQHAEQQSGYQPPPQLPGPSNMTGPVTELEPLTHDSYAKDPIHPTLDTYDLTLQFYDTAYNNISLADLDVAPGISEGWKNLGINLSKATDVFLSSLQGQLGPGGWEGATATAAWHNAYSASSIPRTISAAAATMSTLVQGFAATIETTRQNMVDNYDNYIAATTNPKISPQQREQNMMQYSAPAFDYMANIYRPNIASVSTNNPSFNAGPTPQLHPSNGAPGGGGSGVIPHGGAGGGPRTVGGPSAPAIPNIPAPTPPQSPTAQQFQTTGSSAVPTDPSVAATSPTSGLSGQDLSNALSSPLQSMSQPLESLGQAMSGAQRGNPGAVGGATGAGKLPPGALDLGPKGLKGGGGAGSGAGSGSPVGKPPGAPATAASARTVPAGARAGLSGAAGSPAAGAPAAGAPGGGQQASAHGSPHQPNKALKRKKNGEELIGDTQAVVAVLGEPTRADAAKPEAS